MKKLTLMVLVLALVPQISFARQLQGVAKQYQEQITAQLEVSTGRVKAWPDGSFKVYASAVGANDSQRDDVICAGQMEMIQQAMVVGN